jgi:hypothetical protein
VNDITPPKFEYPARRRIPWGGVACRRCVLSKIEELEAELSRARAASTVSAVLAVVCAVVALVAAVVALT